MTTTDRRGLIVGEDTPADDSLAPAGFDTVAAVGAARVASGAGSLRTSGYWAAGDGGGALYKRVTAQPAHEGKIQSGDGAWWEIAEDEITDFMFGSKADGVTPSQNAINNAIACVFGRSSTSYPGGTVRLPAAGDARRITSSINLLKCVNLLGDFNESSVILADDCDALTPNSVAGFGQQTIRGIYFRGVNATAARTAIKRVGTLDEDYMQYGLTIENNLFYDFDTAIALRSIQNFTISGNWGQNLNQGIAITGAGGNGLIFNNEFIKVDGGGVGAVSNAGLIVDQFNYTVNGGVRSPEGITVLRNQFFAFQKGIDIPYGNWMTIAHTNVVATVYGIRWGFIQDNFVIEGCNVEMQTSAALIGIYGQEQGSIPVNSTIIRDNTVNTVSTTLSTGIQINGVGTQNQNNVIIDSNRIRNQNGYDIAVYNPGGNTQITNNTTSSTGNTGSILAGSPVTNSRMVVSGNVCANTIDYAVASDLTSGRIRSYDNVIPVGFEQSSWTITSGAAPFITFAGPSTSRKTYTLPNADATLLYAVAPVTLTGTSGSVGASDTSVIVNASGTFTLTLPSAGANTGRHLRVKSIAAQTINSASANVVPLAGGAAGTAILTATAGKWAEIESDGTNWIIMAAG